MAEEFALTRSVTITVVTANIGRGVSTDVAHENIHRIAENFPGAFVGFQEIDEADSPDEATLVVTRFPAVEAAPRTGLHEVLASSGRGTYAFAGFHGPGWKRATPIAVPTTWEILRHSVRKSCNGLAHVTPTRVIVSARCRPVDDPDFPPVVFLNGHYPLARKETAKKRWKDCQASWTERANEVHDRPGGGFSMITTRDTNLHGRMPKIHSRERQLLPSGIDRISVIPAEPSSPHQVTVRVLRHRVVNLTIDGHDAHAVDLRLTAQNA
jgi:hypothetical protein